MAEVTGEILQRARARREPKKRTKWNYIGAPAAFKLELACQHLNRAFPSFGCYVVGSALERADWRDVDVRMILSDDDFVKLFPDAGPVAHVRWEFDARWLVMTVSISAWLHEQTGLPIDFQFQPQTHANGRHGRGKGTARNACGLIFARSDDD